MREDLRKWFEEELKLRGIEFTEEVARRLLERIDEEFEWTAIAPELYKGIREKTIEAVSESISRASEELEKIRAQVKDNIKIFPVEETTKANELEVVAADASSYVLPLTLANFAMMSGTAVRIMRDGSLKHSITCDVLKESSSMSHTYFLFLLNAKRESLLPKATMCQLVREGATDFILLDGPLSVSEWYKEAYACEKVRDAVNDLLSSRNDLMNFCQAKESKLISVVKRMRSRYFHNYFNLEDEYTDSFVFNQTLPYGYRTESMSINEAVKRWAVKSGPNEVKRLLINKLSFEIYGFYIKTSANPLVHPIRVEFPEFMLDHEDEIASYVLSTAITSDDPTYDGLPRAQCLADSETKIARRAMQEILRELLARVEKPDDIKLLALVKGTGIE